MHWFALITHPSPACSNPTKNGRNHKVKDKDKENDRHRQHPDHHDQNPKLTTTHLNRATSIHQQLEHHHHHHHHHHLPSQPTHRPIITSDVPPISPAVHGQQQQQPSSASSSASTNRPPTSLSYHLPSTTPQPQTSRWPSPSQLIHRLRRQNPSFSSFKSSSSSVRPTSRVLPSSPSPSPSPENPPCALPPSLPSSLAPLPPPPSPGLRRLRLKLARAPEYPAHQYRSPPSSMSLSSIRSVYLGCSDRLPAHPPANSESRDRSRNLRSNPSDDELPLKSFRQSVPLRSPTIHFGRQLKPSSATKSSTSIASTDGNQSLQDSISEIEDSRPPSHPTISRSRSVLNRSRRSIYAPIQLPSLESHHYHHHLHHATQNSSHHATKLGHRRSPTEIALSRLDEILRGNYPSTSPPTRPVDHAPRSQHAIGSEHPTRFGHRTQPIDLLPNPLPPPQRPRKRVGIPNGCSSHPSGRDRPSSADVGVASTTTENLMNAISTAQEPCTPHPDSFPTQKSSPRANKVVIDPKTWNSISISAAKYRRQQHDAIPNGPESEDRHPTWTRPLILSPTLDSTETNPITIDRSNDLQNVQEAPRKNSICLDGEDRRMVSEAISIIEPGLNTKMIDGDEEEAEEEEEEDRILLPVDRRLLLPSSSQPGEGSTLIGRSIAHSYSLSIPSSRSSTTTTTSTATTSVSSCSSSSSLS